MNKTILVTGATAGFGRATAERFAQDGDNLIICGRRRERLDELKLSLEDRYDTKVLALSFDVRDQAETSNHLDNLAADWEVIDVLVNNAGLASGYDTIQEGDIEDWNRMIDTNIKGLLYVSKSIIPRMVSHGKGHVINIGSTAGKEVYAMGNVYCGTKHAVDAINKGMRIDLLGTGIKVTQVSPGAAETEFSEVRFHGDGRRAKEVYQGYQPMSAADIAGIVHYVTTLPDHLCINDLVVTSLAQASSTYIHRDA